MKRKVLINSEHTKAYGVVPHVAVECGLEQTRVDDGKTRRLIVPEHGALPSALHNLVDGPVSFCMIKYDVSRGTQSQLTLFGRWTHADADRCQVASKVGLEVKTTLPHLP